MTGRMIHHAGWFVALGPLIPLPLILFLPRVISVDELLNHLPEVLSLTWGIGFLPALLTGIFMAILTGHADCAWYYRMLAGGIAGPLITAICCGIIGAVFLFNPAVAYLGAAVRHRYGAADSLAPAADRPASVIIIQTTPVVF